MVSCRPFGAKNLLAAVVALQGVLLPGSVRAADDTAGAAADEGTGIVESVVNPLYFDPDLAIWTVVIFLLMLWVLKKFAWGPIVEALEAREKRVSDYIAAAEAKHEEAKGLLAAHEARLASAKDEVREMLEEARRDAEATKAQIVAEADTAAKAHRDRAVRDIEQARDSAVRSLAETSANLAVDLAGKVVRQNLTGDQQAELVREAITKLAGSSPSHN